MVDMKMSDMKMNPLPLSSVLEELIGLDFNSNVVKDLAEDTSNIPVVDICSSDDDDSGLELGFHNKVDLQSSDACLSSPVKERISLLSPSDDSVKFSSERTSLLSICNNVRLPVSLASLTTPDQSAECSSQKASFMLENTLPSVSELSSLGVKDVLASFLNHDSSAEVPSPAILHENVADFEFSTNSDVLEIDLSKSEEIELQEIVPEDDHSLSSLDSGTVPSPSTEAVLLQESLQLKSTFDQSINISIQNYKSEDLVNPQEFKTHLPVPFPSLKSEDLEIDPPITVLTFKSGDGDAKVSSANTAKTEFEEFNSLPEDAELFSTVTIPSPPPACQLYDKEDEDSLEVIFESVTLPFEADERAQNVKSEEVQQYEPSAAIDESEVSLLGDPHKVIPDVAESTNSEIQINDAFLDEVLPVLLDLEEEIKPKSTEEKSAAPISPDVILASQSKLCRIEPWNDQDDLESKSVTEEISAPTIPDVAQDTNQSKPSSTGSWDKEDLESNSVSEEISMPLGADVTSEDNATQSKPSWAVPWISTDDAENADNNDPAWELMKKLKTDEERYRVVREQWRQLNIPNPRRNLTCHNYRRTASQLETPAVGHGQSKKRARSDDEDDDGENPSKRIKLYHCTQMFKNKIQNLRQEVDKDIIRLDAEHERRLSMLSVAQQKEHQRLMNSTAPYHVLRRDVDHLTYLQEREVENLQRKYKRKMNEISGPKLQNIEILEKASKEVLAFNKFYTDLGDSNNNDHCNITEEEMQQFEETEQMLEAFDQIYAQ